MAKSKNSSQHNQSKKGMGDRLRRERWKRVEEELRETAG
jgi:hypothetical protein